MKTTLCVLSRDTRGAGFVEYIILVGLIAMFCMIAYRQFGTAVSDTVKEQGATITGISSD